MQRVLKKTNQIEHIKSHQDEKEKENEVEKGEQILDKQEDKKGERFVDQIERHDNELNNDVIMARPDLLIHTFDLKNESLVMGENNEKKHVNKKFNKFLDKIHKKSDKRLDHIEHVNKKGDKEQRKENKHEVKKIETLVGDQKDLIVEDKGENLVNQIERHGNKINNEVVMGRPDVLIHTLAQKMNL